jgi:hypothetical protein
MTHRVLKRLLPGLFRQPDRDPGPKRLPLANAPVVDDTTFLFIGGLHRSGTSILHRLLREHPQINGFHDTGAPEDEGQHLQSVFPTARVFGGPGRFAFSRGAHLTESSPCITTEHRDRLLKEWGAYLNFDGAVIIEKSPPNLIRSTYFRRMFPNSKYLFLLRHPIPVAIATQKWSRSATLELLLHAYVAHRIMIDDLRRLDGYGVLRYEELVRDPRGCCSWIQEALNVAQIDPVEPVRDCNDPYFERWAAEFEPVGHTLMKQFPEVERFFKRCGYSMTPPYVQEVEEDLFAEALYAIR